MPYRGYKSHWQLPYYKITFEVALNPLVKVLRVVEIWEAPKALYIAPFSFALTLRKQSPVPRGCCKPPALQAHSQPFISRPNRCCYKGILYSMLLDMHHSSID